LRHFSRYVLACAALLLAGCADGGEPLLSEAGQPVLAAAPAGSTTRIFSGDLQAAVVGDTLPDLAVLQVLRADSTPAKGVTVTWTVTSGGGTLVVASGYTNATGRAYARWKLGSLVGFQTLQAQTDGAGSVTFNARGIPANSRLEVVSGNGQTAPADSALPQPLVLRLVEPTGTPIQGGRITWSVVAGGGRLDSLASTTGADGQASRRWTLGSVPGEQRVRATVRGLPPLEFTAASSVPGTTLAIFAGNGQTGTQYDTLTQALVVRVARADGTPIEGVTVTWATAAQYGGFRFTQTRTNSTGRAYNVWRLGKPLGTQTATATVAGVGTVTFSATSVFNGRTLSVVSGSGQQGQPGDTLPQPLVMRVADQAGRGIRGVKVQWTGVNGARVDSAITYTDVNGLARNRWILGSRLQGQEVRASVLNSGEVAFTAVVQPVTGPQIVFRSNRSGTGIWAASPDGTRKYPIFVGMAASEPDWSPDGSRIVFVNPQTNIMWIVNADGSNAQQLRSGLNPAWSPTGDRIAFYGSGASGTGLYVVNVNGTGLTLLRAGAYEPTWSPDGARIAFRSATQSGIIDADGTDFVALNLGASPSWSPDGTRIAYHTDNPDCACEDGRVWVQPVAGGPAVLVATFANEPDWSPDGTQLAFVSYDTYNKYHSLGVMNADGSNRRILESRFNIYSPSWKPAP
jgi:Tol biopolymer transport system component